MSLFSKSKPKVFCIGQNKTGTTTLEAVLKGFGYKMGDQVKGELLFFDWYQRNFKSLFDFCKTADAFQDFPFSLPYTYMALDQTFKNAKFILTVRDDPQQWYVSLTQFHSKLWADGQRLPTADDLKQADYRYKGYTYETFKLLHNTADDNLYAKETLISSYERHNFLVQDYFRSRPDKLLVINVNKREDYAKLCQFLNQPVKAEGFPWKNKTMDL